MSSEQETRVELHGHEGQPFANFSEDATYLEAVTYPAETQAIKRLREEGCDSVAPLTPVFMRYGPPDTDEQRIAVEWTQGPEGVAWWECTRDHPDAVPFWKDGPDQPATKELPHEQR